MTVFDHIHDRLLARAGLCDPPRARFTWQQLQHEWSPHFEQLMRNRMMMGCLRYGTLEWKRKHGHAWDLTGAIDRKLEAYRETGNTELLVDIANYCLLEFECGPHPLKHFDVTDDQDHCRKL